MAVINGVAHDRKLNVRDVPCQQYFFDPGDPGSVLVRLDFAGYYKDRVVPEAGPPVPVVTCVVIATGKGIKWPKLHEVWQIVPLLEDQEVVLVEMDTPALFIH